MTKVDGLTSNVLTRAHVTADVKEQVGEVPGLTL